MRMLPYQLQSDKINSSDPVNLTIHVGTHAQNGPHVSFSIKPNETVEIQRNVPVQIIWQIQDTRCQPNGWRAEVGVRSETLLLYPRANQSEPNENFSSYSVSAVRGDCDDDGPVQTVNITFMIFVNQSVNFTEYIFCEIFIPSTASIRSEVCLFLVDSTTDAVVPETTTTASDSPTSHTSVVNVANEIISTSSSQSLSIKQAYYYSLLVCAVLVLSLSSV